MVIALILIALWFTPYLCLLAHISPTFRADFRLLFVSPPRLPTLKSL